MKLLLVLAALVGLVALGVLTWVWGAPWLWLHRWTLIAAFDGEVDTSNTKRYEFVCAGFDCDELLPRLPPVTAVSCSQSMVSDNLRPTYDVHIVGRGACCLAQFGNLGRTEIHIYRQSLTYKILLTEPRMREIASALAAQSPSG